MPRSGRLLSAQEQIDTIRKTLEEATACSGLAADDASVTALRGIMLDKVAQLEAAKAEVAPIAESPPSLETAYDQTSRALPRPEQDTLDLL